jgi:Zn-finger nucleic acid-binding protein
MDGASSCTTPDFRLVTASAGRNLTMPLHTSPIDGAPMRTIRRYGIEIDICPTSGGIWLDRGELEKLVEIIREDAVQEIPSRARLRQNDDDFDDDASTRRGRMDRKSRLLDLFDF